MKIQRSRLGFDEASITDSLNTTSNDDVKRLIHLKRVICFGFSSQPGILNFAMNIQKLIEHTLLKPEAGESDVRKICAEAIQHQFFGVCVNSCYVALAHSLLKEKGPKLVSVIGFPLGTMESKAKAFETSRCIELGADEIDMVINIGALKDKRYHDVQKDIETVVKACQGHALKVIIETGLLSDEEKVMACKLSKAAGAQFVKTCTGFSQGQAEVSDIELMRKTVGPQMGIKASGGIKTVEKAQALIQAGADRLGTSSGVLLVSGKAATDSY